VLISFTLLITLGTKFLNWMDCWSKILKATEFMSFNKTVPAPR